MSKSRDAFLAYAMLLPGLLILAAFGVFPVIYAFYLSLHEWVLMETRYAGFANYARLLGGPRGAILLALALGLGLAAGILGWGSRRASWTSRWIRGVRWILGLSGLVLLAWAWRSIGAEGDKRFMLGLKNTLLYAVFSVPVELSLSLGLAFALHQKIRMKGFFRTAFILPYVTPMIASALVFKILFSPRETSMANRVIGCLGIGPLEWLREGSSVAVVVGQILGIDAIPRGLAGAFPSLALSSIIVYNIWVYVGYDTVIFLAGLSNIPSELFDAASIDGANRRGILRHVVLPLLSPTLYFLSIVGVIGTFKAFNHIYVMRTRGATKQVDTASIVIFNALRDDPTYASCMALGLFAIILSLTLVQKRLAAGRVFYG